MPTITYNRLALAVNKVGGRWYDTGDYNLNIVGIRSDSRRPGQFDDWITVSFRQNGAPLTLAFRATTDPGADYLKDPINPAGTAILKPGHYPGLWKIGLHRGKYEALVQSAPCTVYRDTNRDAILDDGPAEETGYFGINLHHARGTGVTEEVGLWSAGCQVLADADEFALLMTIAHRARIAYGPTFSYTLIRERIL